MKNGITRRALLGRAGAASLAVLGAPALLAACTPSGATPAPSAAASQATAAAASTGRAGGRITYAVLSEGGGTDPHSLTAYTAVQFFYRVYDQLVGLDATGNVVPSVATSWMQPSPTSWVFKLRNDVKFSNGRALRASDVVGSFQRLYDPKLKFFQASLVGPVQQVKALDDLTVQFDLQKPFGPFLSALSSAGGSILPIQELNAGTFDVTKDMLGSGPFMLKEALKGESWTFTRNPNYWRAGLPKADELVLLIVSDQSARIAALQSGRADIAIFDSVDAAQLLSSVPNVKVVAQSLPDFYLMWVNEKTPQAAALKDPRVRQAIDLAIDRDQIVRAALGGRSKPAFGTVPGLADDCDASKLPKRDVAKAKSLLADAGATGLSFEIMIISVDQPGIQIAQVIQQNVAEAGMNAKVQPLEQGTFRNRSYLGNDPASFDCAMTFTSAYGDNWIGLWPWSLTLSSYTSKFQLADPAYEALLDKAGAMAPGSERAATFQQMCTKIAEKSNIIPLATKANTVAYRSDRLNADVGTTELRGNFVRFIPEYSRKD